MSNQYWVYHAEHEAKVVEESEYFKLLENGWVDNPGKCVKSDEVKTGLVGNSSEAKQTTRRNSKKEASPAGDEWPLTEKVGNDDSGTINPDSLLSK